MYNDCFVFMLNLSISVLFNCFVSLRVTSWLMILWSVFECTIKYSSYPMECQVILKRNVFLKMKNFTVDTCLLNFTCSLIVHYGCFIITVFVSPNLKLLCCKYINDRNCKCYCLRKFVKYFHHTMYILCCKVTIILREFYETNVIFVQNIHLLLLDTSVQL